MQASLNDLICRMLSDGTTSALANHLDEYNHLDAPVVRALTNPIDVVKLLAGDVIEPSMILELPISDLDKLDIVLLHAEIEDATLFGLACDFVEHVLPVFEQWNEFDERPRNALDTMRRWIDGATNDNALRAARDAVKWCDGPREVNRVVSAVKIATSPWRLATHCVASRNAFDTATVSRLAAGQVAADWQIEVASSRLGRYNKPNRR